MDRVPAGARSDTDGLEDPRLVSPRIHRRELFDSNGNIGPSIWADGRIVGGWAQAPTGDVRWRLLEDLGGERAAQVERRAAELTEWHAGVAVIPKFRTPLQHALREA